MMMFKPLALEMIMPVNERALIEALDFKPEITCKVEPNDDGIYCGAKASHLVTARPCGCSWPACPDHVTPWTEDEYCSPYGYEAWFCPECDQELGDGWSSQYYRVIAL